MPSDGVYGSSSHRAHRAGPLHGLALTSTICSPPPDSPSFPLSRTGRASSLGGAPDVELAGRVGGDKGLDDLVPVGGPIEVVVQLTVVDHDAPFPLTDPD